MSQELSITTERIDDFPLLLGTMKRIELPGIIDRHLRRHGLQQGLSWGWVATIWLAHILTESNHRKLPVQNWVRQAGETIEQISGMRVRELDFSDDRLTLLLGHLGKAEPWAGIEIELGQSTIRVYALPVGRVRLDGTTISGYHTGGTDSLFQYGFSKDDPTLKQVKLMMATLDPLGMPLVSLVAPGNRNDDPLYIPAIDQVLQTVRGEGLLFVGDCKMSALATRAHVHHRNQHYLCPLAPTNRTLEEMAAWIAVANHGSQPLETIERDGERLGEGYEFARCLQAEEAGQVIHWTERVIVVRSERFRQILLDGLEKHLQRATERLLALTPPPARGKRQIRDERQLLLAAEKILEQEEVSGLLNYTFERQETTKKQYIGRGRGHADRPQREIVTVRYQITTVTRQTDAIATHQQTFGWRIYVTDMPAQQLSLPEAVLAYRDEWLIERGFHRLKGVPLSLNPLFVKRDDQVVGLTNLLTIAVRLLTLIEFVVRRNLQQNHETLVGLIENNPRKGIDNPTTERLLKAFDNITLSIVHLPDQTHRHVPPLSPLQIRILQLLGLSPDLYAQLANNS